VSGWSRSCKTADGIKSYAGEAEFAAFLAVSDGPGKGTAMAIELPVTQAAVPQLESDADE